MMERLKPPGILRNRWAQSLDPCRLDTETLIFPPSSHTFPGLFGVPLGERWTFSERSSEIVLKLNGSLAERKKANRVKFNNTLYANNMMTFIYNIVHIESSCPANRRPRITFLHLLTVPLTRSYLQITPRGNPRWWVWECWSDTCWSWSEINGREKKKRKKEKRNKQTP
jgi:hypothetical protein